MMLAILLEWVDECIDWFQALPLYVQFFGVTASILVVTLVKRSDKKKNDYRSVHLAYNEAVMQIRLDSVSIAKYNFWRCIDSEKYMLRSCWVILDALLLRAGLLSRLLSEANVPVDVYRKVLALLCTDHEVQIFSDEIRLWVKDRKKRMRFFPIVTNRQSMHSYDRSHVL